jgi:uncharacterized protein (DUF1501 family)
MLDFISSRKTNSGDEFSRRDMLRVGAISALGLSTAGWAAAQAQAAAAPARPKAKSVIQLWMAGGPSHLDTFDPKPEAPEDFRGPLKAIDTKVPGIRISELLPLLAQQADKYSILRGSTHPSPAHEVATHIVGTGNVLAGGLVYPTMGSVVALYKGYDAGYRGELPPYVALTNPAPWYGESGFLGGKYKPFSSGGDPNAKDFRVRGLQLASGLTKERTQERQSLLEQVDSLEREIDDADLFSVVDTYYQRAYGLIMGQAKAAFDLSQESDKVRDRYGRTTFGQSCLLARRLVERGVPYITVNKGGWDTHSKNFEEMPKLALDLDRGFSALLEDLHQRGLLDSTVVVWHGEFGRTPKIDWGSQWQGGRHHYPNAFSAVIAGGGFHGGHAIGASDERGETVKDRPCLPWDVCASIYRQLGINHNQRLPHPQGRVAYVTPLVLGTIVSGGLLDELI